MHYEYTHGVSRYVALTSSEPCALGQPRSVLRLQLQARTLRRSASPTSSQHCYTCHMSIAERRDYNPARPHNSVGESAPTVASGAVRGSHSRFLLHHAPPPIHFARAASNLSAYHSKAPSSPALTYYVPQPGSTDTATGFTRKAAPDEAVCYLGRHQRPSDGAGARACRMQGAAAAIAIAMRRAAPEEACKDPPQRPPTPQRRNARATA